MTHLIDPRDPRVRATALTAADRVWVTRAKERVVSAPAEHIAAVIDAALEALAEPALSRCTHPRCISRPEHPGGHVLADHDFDGNPTSTNQGGKA